LQPVEVGAAEEGEVLGVDDLGLVRLDLLDRNLLEERIARRPSRNPGQPRAQPGEDPGTAVLRGPAPLQGRAVRDDVDRVVTELSQVP
jgi:hypothetical protein